jgi:hypothetical protein
MEMISHETIGVHFGARVRAYARKRFEERPSIMIVNKDGPTVHALCHDVMDGAVEMDPESSSHNNHTNDPPE